MRHLGILLLGLLPLIAPAQVVLKGQILDSLSGAPVSYASYIIKGTTRGGAADENGRFRIAIGQLPITLIINSIGYKTKFQVIQESDTLLIIRMSDVARQLREVVIEADPVKCIQKDPALMAVDFEFYDNYLLLLAHRDFISPSRLQLLDIDGAVIADLSVHRNAESLYRDCLGNVHLLTKDSAFQIYYDYEHLQLLYPILRIELEKSLYPCKLFLDGKLYLQYSSYKKLRNYYYESQEGVSKLFHYDSDTEAVNYLAMKYDLRFFLNKRKRMEGYAYPVWFLKEHLDEFRSQLPLDFDDQIFLHPLNSPLIAFHEHVWVFQFQDSVAIRFNKDCSVDDSVRINLSKQNNWTKEILHDEVTDDLYTAYINDGILSLYKLDSITLQPTNKVVISGKTFISKVKIRSGVIYFLYLDRIEDKNRMLFRMRL